jgi:hypothetical protein
MTSGDDEAIGTDVVLDAIRRRADERIPAEWGFKVRRQDFSSVATMFDPVARRYCAWHIPQHLWYSERLLEDVGEVFDRVFAEMSSAALMDI